MQPMDQFKTKALLINGLLAAFLNAWNLVMSKSTRDILPQDLQTTLQDLIFFPNTSVVYLVTS